MMHLIILGEPKAQKRHRHVNMGKFVRQYDPSAADKGDFLAIIQSNAPKTPLAVPLQVDVIFYFTRPKSHFKTGKNAHIMKDTAPLWHTSRPDVDNCFKFFSDAMNGIYYKDDSYLTDCRIKKQYSENPRTEITITIL